ncbi:MAG: ribosome biogenesis GTP-binding protein YihA/YsxC [Ethanoligenens sp.]
MSLEKILLVHTRFEQPAYRAADIPPYTVPEIVFAGRSNVGKSSMLNKLANQKSLARVSSVPGKTVSVNFYRCDRPGDFRLVDLPGYGYAKAARTDKAKWSSLVESYLIGRPVTMAVQLVDGRRPLTEDDEHMLHYFSEQQIPFIIAMTKMDKMKSTEQAARKNAFPAETGADAAHIIPFSARTGMGVAEFTAAIAAALPDAEQKES